MELRGTWIIGVVVVALASSACQRPSAEQTARVAQLENENRELRAQLDQARRATASGPPVKAGPVVVVKERSMSAPDAMPEEGVVRQLRGSLAEANASIGELHTRILNLEARIAAMQSDNQRLAAEMSEVNDKLTAAARAVESARKETSAKDERLVQLESANRRLSEENNAQSQRGAGLARAADEFEQIHRRRASYVNSILARYREVTEQYRALAASLESRRPNEGASGAVIDLSRIQQAIAMAEEDLRQLGTLDAQAARAQKKLAGAVK